jgi:DNA-binding response OmpR family regulator
MRISILIVDDDPRVIDSLRDAMAEYDVDVDATVDAATATTMLDQRRYCGLVLDLVLRDSSGFDVLRHMSERAFQVPTIVITEKLPSYVREMLDEKQVKLVFPKPVEGRLLAAVVKGLCGIA